MLYDMSIPFCCELLEVILLSYMSLVVGRGGGGVIVVCPLLLPPARYTEIALVERLAGHIYGDLMSAAKILTILQHELGNMMFVVFRLTLGVV